MSPLLIVSNVLERLLFKRIYKDLEFPTLLHNHQFGFRAPHSTTQQVHRLVNKFSKSLEEKKFCNADFLDIFQAFDKVWHPGSLYKFKKVLSSSYYVLLKSYLNIRHFSMKNNNVHPTSISSEQTFPKVAPWGHYCSWFIFLTYLNLKTPQ